MRDADFSTPQATHPVPVRIANALGGPFTRRVDLSSDAIVARALRSLPDAAESDIEFRPALDALCHSLQHETDFNAIGRTSAKGDTVRLLQTQIRINQLLRSRPEILETELPRPIYVIGLPRSGTTILHSLLAQDPEHRALRYFEGFDPTLPATRDVQSRQKLGRMLAGLEYVSPSYRAIHAMDADSIEECVTVMYHSFSTIQMEFQYECPSYLRFLEDQGTNAPYAYYRKQLQLLQFHRPHGKRWVLKDPAHLVALDTLQELFPDASFVWIHRDPARVLSSIASLTAYTRAIFSDHYDAESIGRTVTDGVWPRALARGLELREQLPEDRFVDLRYADFVADPIASLERVYEQLNLTFTAAARSAMAEYLRAHSQHSEGAHRHSLEQFGIDPASESRRHASYRERFDIPREI
jgi:hypothetical protein